jgi:putative transposase
MEGIIMPRQRKSYIEIGKIYFWTATINKWQKLLLDDNYKDIIIQSLDYLSTRNKIDVFGFVIMPTHIHLIWRTKEQNGKESAQASFLKHTAHQFKKKILKENAANLASYAVTRINKKYEFWKRDSMAIELYSPNVAFQKLDYIHNNPITGRWQLAIEPADYLYSSANFYENGIKDYPFLKNLSEEFLV